jgi:hypothetical protein
VTGNAPAGAWNKATSWGIFPQGKKVPVSR